MVSAIFTAVITAIIGGVAGLAGKLLDHLHSQGRLFRSKREILVFQKQLDEYLTPSMAVFLDKKADKNTKLKKLQDLALNNLALVPQRLLSCLFGPQAEKRLTEKTTFLILQSRWNLVKKILGYPYEERYILPAEMTLNRSLFINLLVIADYFSFALAFLCATALAFWSMNGYKIESSEWMMVLSAFTAAFGGLGVGLLCSLITIKRLRNRIEKEKNRERQAEAEQEADHKPD